MTTEIVIPIGPGDKKQSVPIDLLLHKGLSSVKSQTHKTILTCAVDSNLSVDKIKIIEKYADNIYYYPEHSYFRAGGIWLKIWESWEKSKADFVGWHGYDDWSGSTRIEGQVKSIKKSNSCFCNSILYKNNKHNPINNSKLNFKSTIGKHPQFMGSFIIRRNSILNSGIGDHKLKWSYYFEGLLYAYIMKTGIPSIANPKAPGCYFVYNDHSGTISHTAQEKNDWVKEARLATKYSESQCIEDWNSIGFAEICDKIKGSIK